MVKRRFFDGHKKFGILTLLISLFFMLVVADGSQRILYISGIVYSLVLFFHTPLKRLWAFRTVHPVRAYGSGVLLNGLFMETLAYASNLDKIRAGQQVFLFSTSSLLSDLLIGLPYYLSFAFIFAWAARKYDFSALSLGVVIFLGQAMTVDSFSHLFELLSGNAPGFLMAGLMMLFTLHAPILLFEDKIREQYPHRSRSFLRYPVVIILQLVPLAVTFALVFVKFNILKA